MKLVLRNVSAGGDRTRRVESVIRRAHGKVIDTSANMVLFEASPSAAELIAQSVPGWQLAPETMTPTPGQPRKEPVP